MRPDPYEEKLTAIEARAQAADWEREIAIQLVGRVGCRADEVTYPTDDLLRWSSSGECWLLEIRGKNTDGGDKKTRDAFVTVLIFSKGGAKTSPTAGRPKCSIIKIGLCKIRRAYFAEIHFYTDVQTADVNKAQYLSRHSIESIIETLRKV